MFTGVGGFELGFERANNNKFNTEAQDNDERGKPNTSKCNGDGWWSCSNGFEFKCIGVSEIDKYSNELLKKRFPTVKNWGDCTKINPSELPDFDMLCGGFPCQTFSIAGKRRGFQDTRGTMFFEVARIIKVKRPKIILLENVKGLLNHNKGETFRTIIQTLSELGYDVQWMVLNSKFFGVPQNRERVFIIGSLRGEPRPEILPFGEISKEIIELQGQQVHPTITEAIGRQGSSSEYKKSLAVVNTVKARHTADANGSYIINECKQLPQAQRIRTTEGVSQTLQGQAGGQGAKTGLYVIRGRPRYNEKGERELKFYEYDEMPTLSQNCAMGDQKNMIARAVLTPDRADKRQNGRRFKEDGEPSFTLTQQDKHRVYDGMQIRRLTPKECERLQGFPDNWTKITMSNGKEMSDTQRYKQMGNAVTVNVIEAIGKKIAENG